MAFFKPYKKMNTEPFAPQELKEFDNHRLVTCFADEKTKLRAFVAIHRGGIVHPAFGATRIWPYEDESEALADALRLSRLMSYKSALAGLPYGGAKGVIIAPALSAKKKKELLLSYARRINYFKGGFITGSDVGVSRKDVLLMRKESLAIVGVKVDPTPYTAHGVYRGIEACLEHVYGNADMEKRSFAVQGLGKIGFALLELLSRKSKNIAVSDIDGGRVATAKKRYPGIEVVSPAAIHREPVDVFVPCALSGSLNIKTIPEIRASIVAGGANNQLESEEAGDLLFHLNIVYAPDYVVNAGGLISVVHEYEHKKIHATDIKKRVDQIQKRMASILRESEKKKRATNRIANEMAEKIFNAYE
ncbi:MAG TPA: Glu/Leu/Phe/Val dehydrogenase dimerization domain-containing protein [Candidatus Paceibacterota bacterium]